MVPIVRQYKASWRFDPGIAYPFIQYLDIPPADSLTCLFNRPYLSAIGSTVMRMAETGWSWLHGLTEPYEIASLESNDQV
jgi:hypothetical protein